MEIYLFIFLFGLLAFNWPFLDIFKTGVITYLLVLWLAFIFILMFVSSRTDERKKGKQG